MAKPLDQATTRALCEAGYLSTREYIEIAAVSGWAADDFLAACERRQAPIVPPRVATGVDTYLSADIDVFD